jgi:hypothetical protein
MRFWIERWNEVERFYEEPVIGEESGEQPIDQAFQDAGIVRAGCYRVRPEGVPVDEAAYYALTLDGLTRKDTPCQ